MTVIWQRVVDDNSCQYAVGEDCTPWTSRGYLPIWNLRRPTKKICQRGVDENSSHMQLARVHDEHLSTLLDDNSCQYAIGKDRTLWT